MPRIPYVPHVMLGYFATGPPPGERGASWAISSAAGL
jgi:hypothetical protein